MKTFLIIGSGCMLAWLIGYEISRSQDTGKTLTEIVTGEPQPPHNFWKRKDMPDQAVAEDLQHPDFSDPYTRVYLVFYKNGNLFSYAVKLPRLDMTYGEEIAYARSRYLLYQEQCRQGRATEAVIEIQPHGMPPASVDTSDELQLLRWQVDGKIPAGK